MQTSRYQTKTGLTSTQKLLVAAPLLLIASMIGVFQLSAAVLGPDRGYVIGFMVYWLAWCIAVPLAVLKPNGVKTLFKESNPRFGKHPKLTAALVFWPILMPLFVMFLPQILNTSLSALVLSILLGVVIGVTEELFWRGLYTKMFPKRLWLGYLYPAVTFGLWHLAPLSILTANVPGGAFSFVLVSVLLGLSWGSYAYQRGNIRWCTAAHIVNDTFGLGGIRWLPLLLAFL